MSEVTQWMVDQLVSPEVQAQIIENYNGPPMDNIRLAWPFKTEEELRILSKWFKQEEQRAKKKALKEQVEKFERAFL